MAQLYAPVPEAGDAVVAAVGRGCLQHHRRAGLHLQEEKDKPSSSNFNKIYKNLKTWNWYIRTTKL